ncbi:MAG: hypothetical protein Tp1100DCM1099271_6 [Prokaryotic dsDNA virus sp.]|nr:MAG: hypothetical protein Tp1102SUR405181_37 [Prokaryotic dsDNA virus sp.]QDP60034.1 MAG: hypothetical protein Tp1100DCM1099271_6 [Prokaryotic dsDNA virus sp.]QDP67102.1 MAG: hypothetical protein Tp1111SUR49671_22 [Prokaryotic dsDNA virus sp.]|tara:strand:+ start:1427 stop:2695 length:1269 start_codon:yes stop_codon:yes gene_type:complete
MSKAKWYIGLGVTLLLMAGFTNAANTSTISDNLLSNNFYDDWSGTNDHFHGPNVLAGVHNEYREQTITLSDHLETYEIQGITQSQLQTEVWFWNQYNQSVTLTQEIVDSNGIEYSNNVTMSGSCSSWNGCGYEDSPTNTIIINDMADDYDITARFSFSVPSQPNNHYAADVRNPELFVTYETLDIDIETTLDVDEWLDDFEEQYIDDFDSSEFLFEDEFYDDEPFETLFFTDYYEIADDMYVEYESLPELPEEEMEVIEEENFFVEEEMIPEEMPSEDDMPVVEEEITEEVIEELPEEIVDDEPEEISEEPSMQEEPEEIDAGGPEQGDITIGKTVFAQTIEVDKVTLSIMLQEQPIMQDANFYAPINIYPDQITIFDDRQIYGNISYVANDPLTVHNNLIVGNIERQQELIQKLESMQWRN